MRVFRVNRGAVGGPQATGNWKLELGPQNSVYIYTHNVNLLIIDASQESELRLCIKSWGSLVIERARAWSLSNRASKVSWLMPGPPKYVKQLPFGLFLVVLGHYFTYFGVQVATIAGPGKRNNNRSKALEMKMQLCTGLKIFKKQGPAKKVLDLELEASVNRCVLEAAGQRKPGDSLQVDAASNAMS